jgi:hypothetical protein
MHSLEIIRVRLAENRTDELLSRIKEVADPLETVGIKVYRHGSIDTDLEIHLHHPTVITQPSESGLLVASLLSEMGLINHSTWVEMDTADLQPNDQGAKS